MKNITKHVRIKTILRVKWVKNKVKIIEVKILAFDFLNFIFPKDDVISALISQFGHL